MLAREIVPVIFSGHNDRAVVTLCRFFSDAGQKFYVVAANDDAIFRTNWRERVLFKRCDSELSVDLMSEVYRKVAAQHKIPVLCPTSEFLNFFALKNAAQIKNIGWNWLLPKISVYKALTNKWSSMVTIRDLIGLRSPSILEPDKLIFPLVLKPKKNVQAGKVSYPIICQTKDDFFEALKGKSSAEWFAQEWLDGQSIYLCAYLDRSGVWSAYWQENLCQQPGGKSIVLARTCTNPGINLDRLMSGLHSKGFHGPFMMEIIRPGSGELFFIEVNPRFWGPLELGRKAFPQLLEHYLAEIKGNAQDASVEYLPKKESIYAWAFGARKAPLRIYPAFSSIQMAGSFEDYVLNHDIYNLPDTAHLFNCH